MFTQQANGGQVMTDLPPKGKAARKVGKEGRNQVQSLIRHLKRMRRSNGESYYVSPANIAEYDPLLKPAERIVVRRILRRTNDQYGCSWENQKTMAEVLGIPVRSIRRHVQALVEKGYIRIRRTRNRGNEYHPRPLAAAFQNRFDDLVKILSNLGLPVKKAMKQLGLNSNRPTCPVGNGQTGRSGSAKVDAHKDYIDEDHHLVPKEPKDDPPVSPPCEGGPSSDLPEGPPLRGGPSGTKSKSRSLPRSKRRRRRAEMSREEAKKTIEKSVLELWEFFQEEVNYCVDGQIFFETIPSQKETRSLRKMLQQTTLPVCREIVAFVCQRWESLREEPSLAWSLQHYPLPTVSLIMQHWEAIKGLWCQTDRFRYLVSE